MADQHAADRGGQVVQGRWPDRRPPGPGRADVPRPRPELDVLRQARNREGGERQRHDHPPAHASYRARRRHRQQSELGRAQRPADRQRLVVIVDHGAKPHNRPICRTIHISATIGTTACYSLGAVSGLSPFNSRRTGCPAAPAPACRAASCRGSRCGTGRGAAVPEPPCRRHRQALRADAGT